MYSLYQFGFKVEKDSGKWQEQISKLFNLDFNINKFISVYPNIEKNWIESIKPFLWQLRDFKLFEVVVESVHASFNRYQSYVYLTLILKGDITKDTFFMSELKKRFINNVDGFIDNFSVPFKEPEGENEELKYNEILEFQNPILVTDNFNDNTYLKTTVKSGVLYYNFQYEPQNKDNYIRKFRQVYISNSITKELLDHFHSTFVLFHRSYEFYMELSMMDNIRIILLEMSDAFNRVWPTERMKFFMLHRIWHAHLYNKTFFSILELTAQMDTLINQLVVNIQKTNDKYEKQYERVLHNFDIENLKNDKVYKELLGYLKSPYNYRKHSIDNIRSLYEPTDEQICRLRSDNDSRVNFAIQSIMSILTVVFFIWGVLSAWYQTTIINSAMISERMLFNSHLLPSIFTVIASGTALTSIAIWLIISSRNSKTFTKDVQNVIECQKLNPNIFNIKLEKIKSCNHLKNRLLLITELFNIITAYMTININSIDSKIELEYYNKILKAIKEVDKC